MLMMSLLFFFNDTATTEIYTLSLHDALPIWRAQRASSDMPSSGPRPVPSGRPSAPDRRSTTGGAARATSSAPSAPRSEEHTSELQSRQYLVCRLLLEKKKNLHSSSSSIKLSC